jgi:hypothetical protein
MQIRDIGHKYVVLFVKSGKLQVYRTDCQARKIAIFLCVTMHVTTLRKTVDFFIQGRNQGPFKRSLRKLECEA